MSTKGAGEDTSLPREIRSFGLRRATFSASTSGGKYYGAGAVGVAGAGGVVSEGGGREGRGRGEGEGNTTGGGGLQAQRQIPPVPAAPVGRGVVGFGLESRGSGVGRDGNGYEVRAASLPRVGSSRPRAPTVGSSLGSGSSGSNSGGGLGTGMSPSSSNENIEVLFSHSHTRITSFTTPTANSRNLPHKGTSESYKLKDEVEEEEKLLPYISRGERLIASGQLRLYRAKPHNIAFIQSGGILHPVMARSQCWCVDQEEELESGTIDGVYQPGRNPRALFVLKIREGLFWRIEVTGTEGEKPSVVQTFRKVLKRVLAFEKAKCPFERGKGIDVEFVEEEEVEEEIQQVEEETAPEWKPRGRVSWSRKVVGAGGGQKVEERMTGAGVVELQREVEEVEVREVVEEEAEVVHLDGRVEVEKQGSERMQEQVEDELRKQDDALEKNNGKDEQYVVEMPAPTTEGLSHTAVPTPTTPTPTSRQRSFRGYAPPSSSSPHSRSRPTSPRPTTSSSAHSTLSSVLESFDDLSSSPSPSSPCTPTQAFVHRPSTPYRSSRMVINTTDASPASSVSSVPPLCTSAASSSYASSSYSSSPPSSPSPSFPEIHDWTHIITSPPPKPSLTITTSPASMSTPSTSHSSSNPLNLHKPLPIPPITTYSTSHDLSNPFAQEHFHYRRTNPSSSSQPTLRRAISHSLLLTQKTANMAIVKPSGYLVNAMLGIARKIADGAVWGAVYTIGEFLEEGLLGEGYRDLETGEDEDEDWGGWEDDFGYGTYGIGYGEREGEAGWGGDGWKMQGERETERGIKLRRFAS